MTAEQKQALIEDCQRDILDLERDIDRCDAIGTVDYLLHLQSRLKRQQIALAALNAPAANLADLVPDEMTWNQAHSLLDINQCGEDRFYAFMMGANSCRAAILRNIEEAK